MGEHVAFGQPATFASAGKIIAGSTFSSVVRRLDRGREDSALGDFSEPVRAPPRRFVGSLGEAFSLSPARIACVVDDGHDFADFHLLAFVHLRLEPARLFPP